MELKLNIYNSEDEIVKTYTRDSYKLRFGTVEDLIGNLNLDGLKTDDNVELIKVATDVVMNSFDVIKPLLKQIFKGLTDEELRDTDISEIVTVLVNVVTFAMAQITKGSKGKN